MHEPKSDQFATIDRADFDALRRTNPAYEKAPNVVVVSPEQFEQTPKTGAVTRLPVIFSPEEAARLKEVRRTATMISQLRCRDKRSARSAR